MPDRQSFSKFDRQANREAIPLAVGLSVAAFRVSVMPRTWVLLASALILDKLGCLAIGLKRQEVARLWANNLIRYLPERFHDLADKVWIGPLGLAAPFFDFFTADQVTDYVRSILGIVLTLVVWGLFGGAICRVAITRMTQTPMPGPIAALRYACIRRSTIWGTPAVMGSSIASLGLMLVLMGSVVHLPMIGSFLAWLIFPIAIFPAATVLLSICGMFLGWPLMLGAAMTEEEDAFDALSRSFTYVFQAPVSFALTLKIGFVTQTVGFYLVKWFLRGIVALIELSFSVFGSISVDQRNRINVLPDPWTGLSITGDALNDWAALIRHAAVSWPIGFQFAFAAAAYLALRSRVDNEPPMRIDADRNDTSPDTEIGSKALELLDSTNV